jgi:hypothetical protein
MVGDEAVRMTRCALSCALALVLVLPASCGDGSDSPKTATRLSAAEESVLAHSQTSLRDYCRKLALYLAGKRTAPTGADARDVDNDLDRLIALARAKPDARAGNQEPLRLVISDMAEDLEGSNCSGSFEQKLEQGLAELPPEQ